MGFRRMRPTLLMLTTLVPSLLLRLTIAATTVQAAIEEVASEGGGGGGGHRTLVTLGSDVTNSTSTLADVTGLSFAVTASTIYRFFAMIYYTAGATATVARFR